MHEIDEQNEILNSVDIPVNEDATPSALAHENADDPAPLVYTPETWDYTTPPAVNSGGKAYDEKMTKVILWSASLAAVFTAIVLMILLRVFGLLSIAGTVDFRGSQRSIASVQKLQQVWDALSKDFYIPVDEDKMIEFAAAGMVRSVGDIYTTYYTKEEMSQFTQHSAGFFHGVGVYVLQGANGRLRITGFLENSPAQEAGVMVDDEIISVDGLDVTGIADYNTIIEMIKGEAGVAVAIGFYRPSDDTEHEFQIERREIKTENILSHLLYTGEAEGEGAPIGYILIKMFDGSAFEYFKRHLDTLLESEIEGLIIDLRGNPGGDFEETVKIADSLIGEGVIVYTEDRAGNREYRESGAGALGLPICILIDGDTASASEILAGAIKDNGAGRLIGSRSFGKGLVQSVIRLSDGSGLKYTRSRYFTPSGVSINGTGIEPDIIIGPIDDEAAGYESINPHSDDVALDAAIADIENVIDKALHE